MTLSLTAAPPLPDLNDPATFNPRALLLFSWMTGTFIGELEAIEASDYFSIQSSATDATTGRLMVNGAFGLGALASSAHLTSYSDAGGVSQFVGDGKTATPADKPETDKAHAGLHVAATSERWMQLLARVAGTGFAGEKLYFRRNHDGTVSDWRLMYHQGTILGTVSQSGGVPTGAVIERGSNANGEYVRFADGTQICWQAKTTNTAINTASGGVWTNGADITATHAAAFASGTTPSVAISLLRPSGTTYDVDTTLTAIGSTATLFRYTRHSADATARDLTAYVTAIGRWF